MHRLPGSPGDGVRLAGALLTAEQMPSAATAAGERLRVSTADVEHKVKLEGVERASTEHLHVLSPVVQ